MQEIDLTQFTIQTASVPDRENLIVEIWFQEDLIAEINKEQNTLEIEFYLNKRITFDLEDFQTTLEKAKNRLNTLL